MRTLKLLAAGAALVLAGCATNVKVTPDRAPVLPLPGAAAALAAAGPVAFAMTAGTMQGVYGCPVKWEEYVPRTPAADALVVLGHGFMRDLTHMRGWAQLWASRGIPVVILTFCNSSFSAGHHDRNAEDMRKLAATLTQGPVLYAGFSAGGLAALLAAADDPRAVGYLGLDPVDSGGLAAAAAARLAIPALFLEGDPTACNAQGTMAGLVPAREGVAALLVTNSVHCLFEDPTDPACAAVCGDVQPATARADVVTTIRAAATAWLLDALLHDPAAHDLLAGMEEQAPAWQNRLRPAARG